MKSLLLYIAHATPRGKENDPHGNRDPQIENLICPT